MTRMARTLFSLLVAGAVLAPTASAQNVLVPMDRTQANHLRAYGLTYWVLKQGMEAEWFLNYRGGAFLLPNDPGVTREAALRGVTVAPVTAGELAAIRGEMAQSNMEAVPLEKAPKIAIYTPPNSTPWDDAVTMALEYAQIEYETIWDEEVVTGGLSLEPGLVGLAIANHEQLGDPRRTEEARAPDEAHGESPEPPLVAEVEDRVGEEQCRAALDRELIDPLHRLQPVGLVVDQPVLGSSGGGGGWTVTSLATWLRAAAGQITRASG